MILKRTPLRFGALFITFSLVATPLFMLAASENNELNEQSTNTNLPKDTIDQPVDKIADDPMLVVAMLILSSFGSYSLVRSCGKSIRRMIFKKDKRVHVIINK